MMAVEHMMTAHSTFVYKTWLDQVLLDRDFKIVNHEIVLCQGSEIREQ